MAILFSINFQFEEIEYSCLIRSKQIDNYRLFKITVMNGALERLLHDHNCIKEENGIVELPSSVNLRPEKLKYQIATALQQHLNSPHLASTK